MRMSVPRDGSVAGNPWAIAASDTCLR